MSIGEPVLTQKDIDDFAAQQRDSFLIPTFEIAEDEWEAIEKAYRRSMEIRFAPESYSIPEVVSKSFDLSRSMVSWDIGAKFMKLQEECGELAETSLYELGFNQHKVKPDEDSFGEGADVILCVLDVLSGLHKDKTAGEVYAALEASLNKKFKKWEKRIREMERKTNDKSNEDQQLPSDTK